MGDVIREETKRRGLTADSKNTGKVMKELRKRRGEAAVAELCLDAVRKLKADRVVVDGIRSMSEVETFRKSAEAILVMVHGSPRRRFALLRERGRSDDPLTHEMFRIRDERELGVGLGNAIAFADEMVSNERRSPEKLAAEIVSVVDRWVEEVAT